MADLLTFPCESLVPLADDEPVTGDVPAPFEMFAGRLALTFDDTAEEVRATPQFVMPTFSGTLTLDVYYFMKTAATNEVRWDGRVEAVTEADTLDLETAGWSGDSANTTDDTVNATAGNLCVASVTLTNNDTVAAGDLVRICIRRDAANAGDDATGDACLTSLLFKDSS